MTKTHKPKYKRGEPVWIKAGVLAPGRLPATIFGTHYEFDPDLYEVRQDDTPHILHASDLEPLNTDCPADPSPKIYISLPITGDEEQARRKADLLKHTLSRKGYQVITPFEVYAGDNPAYDDYICADLRQMLTCDAILFCRGWQQSCGCRVEHAVATQYIYFGKKQFKLLYEDNSTTPKYI